MITLNVIDYKNCRIYFIYNDFIFERGQRGLLDGDTTWEGTMGPAGVRDRSTWLDINAGRRDKRLPR